MSRERSERKLLITGIHQTIGWKVAKRLHRQGDYQIVGVDSKDISHLPKDIKHIKNEMRSADVEKLFQSRDVHTVIYIPSEAEMKKHVSKWEDLEIETLLSFCQEYNVSKLILLSSAEVYGLPKRVFVPLKEDAPLEGAAIDAERKYLVATDMAVTSFFWKKNRTTEIVIIRPAQILGRLANFSTEFFRLKSVPFIWGSDPMLQFIHQDDVINALLLALNPGVSGIFNLVGAGEIPLSVATKELNLHSWRLPKRVVEKGRKLKGALNTFANACEALWRMTHFPLIDGSLAEKELGFKAKYNIKETLMSVNE